METENAVKTPEVKQPEQRSRVSSRTPKRKAFFDEDQPPIRKIKIEPGVTVTPPNVTKPTKSPKPAKPVDSTEVPINHPKPQKRQSIERPAARVRKPSTVSTSFKAVRKCERAGCIAKAPICFVNATERCAGNGYTSRWYHISPAEHFCNECFEFYYRSHKEGYERFTEWKRTWSSNSKTEASIRTFMVDQILPFWVQCTLHGCGKWRQLSRDLELSSDFISRFMCGMSTQGVKNEKQAEHCERLEDERATFFRTASPWQLQGVSSLLLKSPAIDYLGGFFFPDRVGMSPFDKIVQEYANGKQVKIDSEAVVQPFVISDEPMRALSFDPASMLPVEEAEFPQYIKEPLVYLGLRNLVLALWAKNIQKWLTVEECIHRLICRGISRVRYVKDLNHIVKFLSCHGYINSGILQPPVGFFSNQISKEASVIVVGAGAAGLAAARHLQIMGTKVTVLEGRDRIGGRVYDVETLGQPVGYGAQMVMGHINNPIAVICQQIGLELMTLKDRCDLLTHTGNSVEQTTDRRIDFHFNAMLDIIAEWRKNKEKSSDINLLQKIWEMHQQFVEESQLEFTQEEKQILDFHIGNLEFACGAPLDKVSALSWDQNEAFAQFAGSHVFIRDGISKILTKLSDGLDVRLNMEVSKIDHSTDKINVTTKTGETFTADKVLLTLPLAVLQKGHVTFEPALPSNKLEAINSLGTGLVEKVILKFNKKFWEGKLKDCSVFGHLPNSKETRGCFNVFYDITSITQASEGSHILMSHVTGSALDLIKDKSDEEIVNMCLKVLRTLFPEENVPEPISYIVSHWREDRFAHMAYSYLPVGVDGSSYDIMAEEVNGRVHFAGEATTGEFPQSVTGAYLSGIREANKIQDWLQHMHSVEGNN